MARHHRIRALLQLVPIRQIYMDVFRQPQMLEYLHLFLWIQEDSGMLIAEQIVQVTVFCSLRSRTSLASSFSVPRC